MHRIRLDRRHVLRSVNVALVASALVLVAAPARAHDASPCVRTPGSIYWQVCVNHSGCTLYVWSTMPPAMCLEREPA